MLFWLGILIVDVIITRIVSGIFAEVFDDISSEANFWMSVTWPVTLPGVSLVFTGGYCIGHMAKWTFGFKKFGQRIGKRLK